MEESESKFMLNDAKQLLDEIETSYKKYLSQSDIPRELLNKIRYFLNNIESALDYIAFDIFMNYCSQHVPPEKLESRKKKVNFPLFDSKSWFDKRVNETFPELKKTKPDIVSIFEKQQPFNQDSSNWLKNFNYLVNNNKHRTLTKQERTQTTHVNYMKDIMGNTFVNCTFEGYGTDIMYGDTPFNFSDPKPNPFVKQLSATTYVDFIFKNLGLSVVPTLKDIYSGATSIVSDLEKSF